MDRERRDLHAAPAHEVAGDVIDHLVAVDVRVVVRRRDRQGVVVELARHERADDEIPSLERLVDRRRLVDPARDRLEVGDVEAERPEVAVPADHVERVVAVVVGGDPVGRADVDDELALGAVRLSELGSVEVPLAVRGVFEQLPVVVPIALRRLDLRRRLEVQDPMRARLVRVQPPGRADREDEVVARAIGEVAEDGPAHAAALVDEEHLVGDAVPVELALGHRLRRTDDAEDDVVVEVQRDPAAHDVAARLEPAGLRQAMTVEAVVGRLEPDRSDGLDPVRPRRRGEVIEERAPPGEALDPEQLLGVEAPVRGAVLGVALARDAAPGNVVHAELASSVEEASLGR